MADVNTIQEELDSLKRKFEDFEIQTNKKLGKGGSKEIQVHVTDESKIKGMISIDIPNDFSASGFHIDRDGNTWWGATTYTSAPSRIGTAGGAVFTGSTFNGTVLNLESVFGDGSDGNVTISTNSTISRDMFYNNLTVNAGVILNSSGYRIFVKGTLNGMIARNGLPGNPGQNGKTTQSGSDHPVFTVGTGGAGGAALADGSLKGAFGGKDGQAGVEGVEESNNGGGNVNGLVGNAGSAGSDADKSLVPNSNDGAYSGASGTASASPYTGNGRIGAVGGDKGDATGTIYNIPRNFASAYGLFDIIPAPALFTSAPQNGGSASGPSGGAAKSDDGSEIGWVWSGATGGAGGGGGNAGILAIYARTVVAGASDLITAIGGTGAKGGNAADGGRYGGLVDKYSAGGSAGSAGGNGGNGGTVLLVYSAFTDSAGTPLTPSTYISVNGGPGGTGGNPGAKVEYLGGTATAGTKGVNGATGATGTIYLLKV